MHDHRAFPDLPPGPRGSSIRLLLRWMSDTRGLFEQAHREFGDVFTLRAFGSRPAVCFASPDAAREVLRASSAVLGHANDVTQATLGKHSVLMKNGDVHALARRRLMPALTGEALASYGPTLKEVAEAGVSRLEPGERVPILPWSRRVTLEIMMRCLFGMEGGAHAEGLVEDVLALAEQGQRPASFTLSQIAPPDRLEALTRGRFDADGRRLPDPWWVRPLARHPLVQANRRMQDRMLAHVRGVRAGTLAVPETSMLAMLLRLAERQGAELTDLELATDLITLLVAGHDTTAVSFAWIVLALARHPDSLETLRRELAEHGGLAAADADVLGRLPYLDAVIKESMRLTPIAPALPRTTLAPCTIAGVDLPAGVSVLPLTFAVQRDEALWKDALRFDPSRHLGARVRPEAAFPFGGGYRRCVGAYFATLELKYVLAAFVERVAFEEGPDPVPLEPGRTGILSAPCEGAPVRIRSVAPRGRVLLPAPRQASASAAR